jgi:putative ABC transport system permease protein
MRKLRAWIRNVVRRAPGDRDVDDEFRFHLEMEIEAGLARGLGAAEARREAYRKFGGVDRYKEAVVEERGVAWLDEVRQDVRFAARLLRRSPAFTAVAVATLALGIGANTAIFSVVNGVLLRPLPFEAADALVVVWETDRASETSHEPASLPDIRDFQARSRTLAVLGGMSAVDLTRTGAGEAERVAGLAVDDEVLSLLRVRPLLGRAFGAAEAVPGGERVLLLGERYWRARFGADPGVLGTTVVLNGEPWTVLGVLPAAADVGVAQIYARADYGTPMTDTYAAVWLPLRASVEGYPRQTHPFVTLGRLADGSDVAGAQAELASIAAELEAAYPENVARGVNIEPFPDVVFGPVRPALLLLLGAVALVLLVTCANVANLLLARTVARAREVAVRRALGAPARRLVRQFLVESVVLTFAGVAGGVVLADRGLRAIVALAPPGIPRLDAAGIDGRVLVFTAGVATAVAFAFALLPVWFARRVDIQRQLQVQPGRRVTEGRGGRRLRSALVVAEVALAVSLVISAGLLLRSFWELRAVDPGFRAANVLKAEYSLPAARYPQGDFSVYPNWPAINGFHGELLRQVRALPGVRSAALAVRHPMDVGFTNSFLIVGREAESQDFPEIRTRIVTPGYLETLGIRLLAGRDLRDGDDASSPPVILINQAAVDRYFGGEAPIGQQIQFWGVARQIVGVIANEKFSGLDVAAEPAVYAPYPQAPNASATLLVAANGRPADQIAPVRGLLRALDPQLALSGEEPLEATVAASIAQPRFTALLLGLFAAVAIALALVGVHGVLSYTVAQRTHEMGIRVALGASRGEVVGMVLREGMALAGLGIVLGVLAALAFSRILAGLLFGISGTDALTFVGVTAAVAGVSLLASYLPARRATGVNPMVALRND